MNTFRILILEDDLETLSRLLAQLSKLEEKVASQGKGDIAVTILSEYDQILEYANKTGKDFDLVLLDRDCKAGGSFHCLDFNKYQIDKVIGISSVPEYNESLKKLGVTHIIHKDYKKLDIFADEVVVQVEKMLFKGI